MDIETRHTVIEPDVVNSDWIPADGVTQKWWGRLTGGSSDRKRQFDRFISRLQERYGYKRERAAQLLVRRMRKHRANRRRRD